ncbi:MAG: zinc-binding dehydrogenase, partial [Firmicutes bacterium]|nr:zinc-binding dehydrogenase [Bacillota bacterium]
SIILVVALKHLRLENIFVTGLAVDRHRLDIARSLGVNVIVADREDPVEKIMDFTNGRGADVVFETSGHPSGVAQSIGLAGKDAQIALIGLPHHPVQISVSQLALTEKKLIGIRAYYAKNWDQCTKVLPRVAKDLELIITHRLPLSQWKRAFDLTESREGAKILLTP